MIKILIGVVLVLTASNAVADNVFFYENESKQSPITNADSEDSSDKFTKKVKVIYYNKEGKLESKLQSVSFGTNSDTASYSDSVYDVLR